MAKPFVTKLPYGTTLPGGAIANVDINFLNQVGQSFGAVIDSHTHGPDDYGSQIPLANIPADPTHPQLPLTTDVTGLGRDAEISMLKAAFGQLAFNDSTVDFRQVANVGAIAVLNPTSFSTVTGTIDDHGSGAISASSVITAASWTTPAIHFTATNTFTSGQRIYVSGMLPAGYNGAWTVSATGLSGAGFQVVASNPGTATTLGIATGAVDLTTPSTWPVGSILVGTMLLIDTLVSGVQETVRVVEVQTSGSNVTGFTPFQFANAHLAATTYSIATQAGSLVLGSGDTVSAGVHVSTVPDGTPPHVVESQTLISNMNVEMVGGMRTTAAVGTDLFADPSYVPGGTYVSALNGNGLHDASAVDYDATLSQDFTGYTPGSSTIVDSFAHVRSVQGDVSTAANLSGAFDDMPTALVTNVTVNGSGFPAGELDLTFSNGVSGVVSGHALTVTLPWLTPAGTTGAPASGAHVKGELYIDSAAKLYICTVAGTPGTFVSVGSQT